ncbi:hypothetical protein [Acinetobacter chinensis]|uniref:hypothetical protein n=1 Tax=Acinetobacter chinensis TaxID=2004650 RepID=UPI002934C179|nr:hypothetical protein [Acinetobacter chinensis]WOE42740.1 hypothetical protein QSG87_06350 [Acinetobacter chinensis]
MNALTISSIIKNLHIYQSQYLEIIATSEWYFTPVEDAYIHLWPLKKQQLFLGDLLQLWFSRKWCLNVPEIHFFEAVHQQDYLTGFSKQDGLLFKITGNLLTGEGRADAWQDQQLISESHSFIFRTLCEYKALKRPEVSVQHGLFKTEKLQHIR